jgi:hypothetical protein
MANRSYLYSLDNRPTSYSDRPNTISGLSEWPYRIPFSYYLLLSGSPQLCASLISDGLDNDEPDNPTPLWAISGEFDAGYARLRKLLAALAVLAGPPKPTLAQRIARRLTGDKAERAPRLPDMAEAITDTIKFLDARRDDYLLLEIVELSIMDSDTAEALRDDAEHELALCRAAGEAVDALPDSPEYAAKVLMAATQQKYDGPLSMLHELRLDDYFDHTRDHKTNFPLGLNEWSDVLFFDLDDAEEFENRVA